MFPQTFHLFPRLPIEIRLKIWSFTLSIPRTVTIGCLRAPISRGAPRTAKTWLADTPPPALLQVNRETRYEALGFYRGYFVVRKEMQLEAFMDGKGMGKGVTREDGERGKQEDKGGKTIEWSCPIYLDLRKDVVKFADGVLTYLPAEELRNIRRMILRTEDCGYFGFYNLETIKKMPLLRDLEILAEQGLAPMLNRAGEDIYMQLFRDFEEAMEADPGWDCPTVKIMSEEGKQVKYIEGGAVIPRWVEEVANFSGDEDD